MIGGLAQLVERLLCKQDVSGSSPLTSTDQPLRSTAEPGGFSAEVTETRLFAENSASAHSREG